ncbi:hypothetical protein K469DRAFT_768713 [Zopfia rhizophila CBS 207.26]|uniref:Heterokaryon incompatibility domain-containing protein n=1 Tax=Zopfia rhizophila CBS 207.26 TaxID=1314779 RepID=A0A6A6E8E6_9PEZI|nr:hypothetical protein K469DRAFT_768713 [Zopfia rhizophila CBS 207.26]
MDIIYHEAAATLIATASENSSQGLPGVSDTLREYQVCADVGYMHLLWTFGDPIELIRKSKWMTRGWTYQEGLLSRRCIYFTHQQVYFECQGMHQCKALRVPARATDHRLYSDSPILCMSGDGEAYSTVIFTSQLWIS